MEPSFISVPKRSQYIRKLFYLAILYCAIFEATGLPSCTSVNGVLDGARCFFIGSPTTKWSNSWSVCASSGGIPAELHTDSEYSRITTMIKTQYGNPIPQINIPFRRNTGISGNPCTITNTTTFWYDTATTASNRSAGNTWVRNQPCENWDGGGEYCMALCGLNVARIIYNDIVCTTNYGFRPLCQFTSQSQTYNLTNVCIIEQPIETFNATQPQDCADACIRRPWCRSFNFKQDPVACNSQSCQLFTWSVWDNVTAGPTHVPAPSDQSCSHYNYMP